ncbi:CatB-related O-acetyltransferase [Sinorhizobium americanum]|uniref:CatB-related O-acetyltransferase n=1 Tax=Sinorhizobium americanum TaxID=194963 RepID=UPI001F48584F|nr:CatB-related O-acetyltransferase [Sinorhizobium americanum]
MTGECHIGGTLSFEVPIRLASTTTMNECSIGFMSYLGKGTVIKRSKIGRYCAIGERVKIGAPNHPHDWLSIHPFQYDGVDYFRPYEEWSIAQGLRYRGNSATTVVGNDVWIGDNVLIKQGLNIGDGAVIAAGAIVTKDVLPYQIIGGVPARFIKNRFPDEIARRLCKLRWWNKQIPPNSGIPFDDVIAQIDKIVARFSEFEDLCPTQLRLAIDGSRYSLSKREVVSVDGA